MLFVKYSYNEVRCPKCYQKVKPLLKSNRTRSEFIGSTDTEHDEGYWMVCTNCKSIIGKE